jgi:predicted kinase
MANITLLVGLPRSGKTTWVELNNEFNFNGKKQVIISADKLRYLIYNQRFWSDGEPMMWAVRKIMLKSLIEQGVDIIVDETNTTKKARQEIIKLATKYGYHIKALVFDIDAEVCRQRAIESNQEDLIPIIDRMVNQYEEPDIEEGFNEIITV